MAINVTQQPSGIYPAFNDSYISFASSLTGLTKAEITVQPTELFPNPFLIYPNTNGRFIFNLKDIVKSRMTSEGFEDNYSIPALGWNQEIDNTYLSQTISITDYHSFSGTTTSGSTTELTYEFDRSVKQVGDSIYNNTYQLLNISENGVDYHLTYFEGYPFSFELQRVSSGDTIEFKNVNSGIDNSITGITSTNSQRIYLDKGVSNWTSSNYLPLTDTINLLEIYQNETFKTNLYLKKVQPKCGYYLKWFNQNGGYSYWLFNEFSKEELKVKTLKDVATNPFKNVNEGLKNPTTTIGYEGSKRIELKTRVDEKEDEVIRSLFTSPSVQLYTSQSPYINGKWISIDLDGSYEIYNKKKFNEIKVTIELPSLYTQTL
ncbi:hypothetical protein [Corallibacter sp.]|uniref:hypothetical protein n=1 Tax=Corallibacter sp. TaxID=2038084 RepID=UPI003AB82236